MYLVIVMIVELVVFQIELIVGLEAVLAVEMFVNFVVE